MALPFGQLLGFLIPVFGLEIVSDALTKQQKKDRLFYFFLGKASLCVITTLLTLCLWIPGHSRGSIMIAMEDSDSSRTKTTERTLTSILVKKSFVDTSKPETRNVTEEASLREALIDKNEEKDKLETLKEVDLIQEAGSAEEEELDTEQDLGKSKSQLKEEINKMTVKSQVKTDPEDVKETFRNKEFETKVVPNIRDKEQAKKEHGLCLQLKNIFSKPPVVILIINYGLLYGNLTALAAVCAELYTRFSISQVNSKT